jgi:hypothetical protein
MVFFGSQLEMAFQFIDLADSIQANQSAACSMN